MIVAAIVVMLDSAAIFGFVCGALVGWRCVPGGQSWLDKTAGD